MTLESTMSPWSLPSRDEAEGESEVDKDRCRGSRTRPAHSSCERRAVRKWNAWSPEQHSPV
jgi:hypothetical protein